MKLYTCDNCGNPLYFENSICLNCHYTVGFEVQNLSLIALLPLPNGCFNSISHSAKSFKLCQNAAHGTCNWLIPAEDSSPFCIACALNRTIPSFNDDNLNRWKRIEIAKHRLVYSLFKLNLPVAPKLNNSSTGIAFDFMADVSPQERITTGHDEGVITLNIEEADEAERVRNKLDLGEKYRTLLGHFRHEIGHYYWDVLIRDSDMPTRFRNLFGDETLDYNDALKQYYNQGAGANWSDNFISPYATSHPWEDWAESWSHYLHLMDTLETAFYFGLGVHPAVFSNPNMQVKVNKDPYLIDDFAEVFNMWLPLTFAVNSLNRSMGHPDFYPFVISERVVQKLSFIHEVCKGVVSHSDRAM